MERRVQRKLNFLLGASALLLGGLAIFFGQSWQPARMPVPVADARLQPVDAVTLASLPLARRFDFPMGSANGALVYNAQPFTENQHLGDDLNGIGGENTDLGDPVYSIANGRVLYSGWPADGWGNLILVLHAFEEDGERQYVQACYAHLDTRLVQAGEEVWRGEKIGTVGTAGGKYLAHLHFELRRFITPFIGAGYKADPAGWLNPSEFVASHRGAPEWDLRPEPEAVQK